jgi:hypothetical protein
MALLASPRYAFREAVIGATPEDPGLYALYFGEHLLYLGVAEGADAGNTIRGCLAAHLSGELSPSVATHYTWEISSHPRRRFAELMSLLGAELPPYNNPANLR